MEHRAYPRIPPQLAADTGGPWVATEKLHGANLVVAFDGARVRIGALRQRRLT
ncbi:MAG: RNA ligase family protein [Archangium sp.]|nr:RNA ligase family protein [Archangium sp.]